MQIEFVKMHGCGNDYIFINESDRMLDEAPSLARRLCERHIGIGGDGLVLIGASDVADARMRMFNSDGSEGKMCGNAIRCVGKYLYDSRRVTSDEMTVETLSGIRRLRVLTSCGVAVGAVVDMGRAELAPCRIPVLMDGDGVIDRRIAINGKEFAVNCVSVGNPHCVIFSDVPTDAALCRDGAAVERAAIFPDRVNVEFVTVVSRTRLRMRVWERGSGITRACGTGACASAVAAVLNGYCASGENITVSADGGELTVVYGSDGALSLGGEAVEVFRGTVLL